MRAFTGDRPILSILIVLGQLTPALSLDPTFVPWDFVPPLQFNKLCIKVTSDIGEKTADPEVSQSVCEKVIGAIADKAGADKVEHCRHMSEQLEIYTLQERYHGGQEFCKQMLMFQSYSLKTDLLLYVTKDQLWDACTNSITTAMEKNPSLPPMDAISTGLPIACKGEMEELFTSHGMPIPSATTACKLMIKKALVALEANELDPKDQGKQFCDGKSMQGVAFKEARPSPAPEGFPLTESDWKPKITLAHLVKMVRKAFRTPKDCFKKFDANKDGKLDYDEWAKLGAEFGIPTWDRKVMFKLADGNKDGGIDASPEWQIAIPLTVPDLVAYSNEKHKNAEKAWKAADGNADGDLDPAEFEAFCKGVGVAPEVAKNLMPEIDEDGSGGISQEEFYNAFGVDLPEMKRRAREKFGPETKDSYAKLDPNGDGASTPEEWEKACAALDIPAATAKKLFKEVDTDGSGDISPEEWDVVAKLSKEELEKEIAKELGAGGAAAADAMDTDGDGVVSDDELKAGLKKAGASDEEAEAFAKEMDKDGDGKVSADELHEGTGGAAMDEARGYKHPAAAGDGGAGAGGITVPEFKERAKKKYGTPKAAFDAFDVDPKDGKISPEELAAGGATLDPAVTPQEAAPLFKPIDKNGDGGIDPKEWFEALGGCADCGEEFIPLTVPEFKERAKAKHGTPQAAFDAFDTAPKDGKISPEELAAGGAALAPPVTPEEAAGLFKPIDKNGDGGIDPAEFFEALGGCADCGDSFSPTPPGLAGPSGTGAGGPGAEAEEPAPGQIGDLDGDGKISPEEKMAKTKALDKDGDGVVSPEEMGKAAAEGKLSPEEMKKIDTDGDGKLSADEIKQAADATTADPADQAKALDKDGDGKVSGEELAEAAKEGKLPPAELKKMDKDGDGKLSPEELEQGAKEANTKAAAAAPKEKMKQAMKKKFKSPEDAMKKMDADGDGKISPEEMEQGLKDQGVSPAEAKKMMKDLDKDGDGKVSPEEMYEATGPPGEFTKSPGEPGYVEPKAAPETPISKEEMKNRMGQAFKNGKDAWDKIAGPGATEVGPERFKEKIADLGVGPGEADKMFKEMDKDGDGKVSKEEFQNYVGVEPDEVQDRFVEAFPNPEDGLKAADADGDGKVSEAELQEVMQKKLGLTPENAKKAAKEMMKKLDPSGTGKIDGKAFKESTKPKADDMANAIEKKLGSAGDAMKSWDKDGDGKMTEEEFKAGAASVGMSPEAAADMWKEKAGPGGVMEADDFSRAFGFGPDELLERCFQYYGNPTKAFDAMDADKDGLLSPAEWKAGAVKMKLKPDQVDRLFKDMDSNNKEKTGQALSKWEFFNYMDYEAPSKVTHGDGYGDIDPFGGDHKKFNELPHLGETGSTAPAPAVPGDTSTGAAPAPPADDGTKPFEPPWDNSSTGAAAPTSTSSSGEVYTVDHCSSCDIYDLLQVGDPLPASGVKVVNCCGKIFNATLASHKAAVTRSASMSVKPEKVVSEAATTPAKPQKASQRLEDEVSFYKIAEPKAKTEDSEDPRFKHHFWPTGEERFLSKKHAKPRKEPSHHIRHHIRV